MRFMHAAAIAAAMFASGCVNPVKVVEPISTAVTKNSTVSDVDVTLSPLATKAMEAFELKAAEKRAADKLPPVVSATELGGRPVRDEYSTLPFAQMFELIVQDVTRDWGLSSGRALRLAVEIDTLKTANAGMAILAGSSDQLAGNVTVTDAQTGEKLGQFYVDVINSHGGLLGLAMRGGGIREKLAEEFALHVSQQLTGRKDKSR